MFEDTIRYLKNEIHPHPNQDELKFVIETLNGQGYLTKRTDTEPYVRVVFYDGMVSLGGDNNL